MDEEKLPKPIEFEARVIDTGEGFVVQDSRDVVLERLVGGYNQLIKYLEAKENE